jgi:outer membrane lipoprotein-sorting protein
MSITMSPAVRRWLVPASAALAVIGGGVAIGLVTNAADPALPTRSAEELLVDLQTADVDGLRGTVVARADLGLPPLPTGAPGSAQLSALLSGTHTLRVWYASPDNARLALVGQDSETDIITNGEDLWVWSSKDNTATHASLPEGGLLGGMLGGDMLGGGLPGAPSADPSTPGGMLGGLDPEQLSRMVLSFLGPYTDITTSQTTVAGRDAYELVLAPKDQATLIDRIVIAIDGTERIPLRFAVQVRGSDSPAIEIGFTEVSFERPDASQFEFNPPPGATVIEAEELDRPGEPHESAHPSTESEHPEMPMRDGPPPFELIGEGWGTVLAVDLGPLPSGEEAEDGPAAMLALLPKVSGDWGSGTLLTSRVFSVLLTDDGRLFAGAVGPQSLYEAAAQFT